MVILFHVLPVIIIQLWMDALILPLELSGVIQCARDVTSCQPEELSESLLVYAEGQPLNKYDESLIESRVSAVNPRQAGVTGLGLQRQRRSVALPCRCHPLFCPPNN